MKGSERARLIERLAREKVLLKMSVGEDNTATVTVVTGMRNEGEELLISVDCPDWMLPSVLESGPGGIHFEWSGEDGIPYRFSVHHVRKEGRHLWMVVPEAIWYCQKRRDFRISAPENAFLAFRLGNDSVRLLLADIGLGGLGCEQWGAKTTPVSLMLDRGQVLEMAELHFPSGEVIPVRQAEVRWLDRDRKRGRSRYGIQFRGMDREYERQLTAIVYRCQREYLRRRLPLDDEAWKRLC